jgi:hypothetical protein
MQPRTSICIFSGIMCDNESTHHHSTLAQANQGQSSKHGFDTSRRALVAFLRRLRSSRHDSCVLPKTNGISFCAVTWTRHDACRL